MTKIISHPSRNTWSSCPSWFWRSRKNLRSPYWSRKLLRGFRLDKVICPHLLSVSFAIKSLILLAYLLCSLFWRMIVVFFVPRRRRIISPIVVTTSIAVIMAITIIMILIVVAITTSTTISSVITISEIYGTSIVIPKSKIQIRAIVDPWVEMIYWIKIPPR